MILIGCDYSNGNLRATNEVMTQRWSKYAYITSNAKCNCVEWKTGYATTWDAIFFLQMSMQSFIDENLTIIQ